MKCPTCGNEMKEYHDRGYDGNIVQFWYYWKCECGYVHNEEGDVDEY